MEPITAALAGGLPVVGQLLGYFLSMGDRDQADKLSRAAMQQFNISAPDLQNLVAKVGPGQMSQAQADPMAIEAQKRALTQLQQVGTQGADNIEFRGAMDRANRETSAAANQRDLGLQQQMRGRGLGGSGQEYAVRALANQGAADRQSAAGFDVATAGRQQALQAMQAAGGLGGQMRGQDFGEKSARARAADEIEKFNTQNSVAGYQQNYNNQMGLAGARANAQLGYANTLRGQGANIQQTAASAGLGAGQAVAGLGQNYLEEQRKKGGQ